MPLPDWVKSVSWKLGEGKRGRRKIKEDRNVGSLPLVRKIRGLERGMAVTWQHVGKHASPLQGPCLSSEKTGTALRNGDAHTCKSLKPTQVSPLRPLHDT